MKVTLHILLAGIIIPTWAFPEQERQAVPEESAVMARAREIHAATLTIDSHVDIPFDFATEAVDPGAAGNRQLDLPKMAQGQLDAAFFIVYVGQGERNEAGYEFAMEQAMTKFNAIHRMVEDMYPDRIELAYSAADVGRIRATGRLVAVIGIENGWVIGQNLGLLEQYHQLGARYITLAHNGHNDISDSASPDGDLADVEAEHNGISAFGERVIAEMNRLGMMVDVSHISKQAMLEAARLSAAPVLASHSSVRALANVARNMDDEQLLALGDNGGVIQIVAVDNFLKVDPRRDAAILALEEELQLPRGPLSSQRMERMSNVERSDYAAQEEAFVQRLSLIDRQFPPANVSDFVDHIDYAVNLIGIDHVGISSDFDGGGGIEGWRDASETFNVTLELVRRGYSQQDIRKLWGENLLRVWREAERIGAQLQSQGR